MGAETAIHMDDSMGAEKPVARSKTRVRRLLIGLFRVSVYLLAAYCAARLIWRFSGSNQWELVREGKRVKIYSLKQPGADLVQVKGVVRVRSSLATIVKFMQDLDVCSDIGCHESRLVERVDDQLQYISFRYDVSPFKTREFVVRQHFSQNPVTKEILLEYAAAADKTPPNDCCFRVTNMKNTWRLTPLPNGEVEVEYATNMNEGGFMPDPVLNALRPKYMYYTLARLQKYLDRPKYQNAKYEFVKEL